MIKLKKALLVSSFGIGLSLSVGYVFAFDDECPTEYCEPPEGICHNIGGPQDLGANCDGTGTCEVLLDDGSTTLAVAEGYFLGILIPPDSPGALAAHIAHGDGPIVATYDPPLHLASTGQNHKASNVECLGRRILPQPPEPGN